MPTRLVCLGDSFTEGMCDDLRPDGEYLGWADRVANALARAGAGAPGDEPVEYANLAVRGKLLDQVVVEQLPVAIAMQPTILSFHAGPNDVLRRGTDLADLYQRYEAAIARARAATDRLIVFTAIPRAGGKGRLAQLIADRFAAFNDNVRTVAARHDAIVIDAGAVPAFSDRRLFHVDRLHLNAAGHRRIADAVLEGLGITDEGLLGGPVGWWRVPLPAPTDSSKRKDLAEDAAWVRGHLVPWVGRRLRGVSSGDGRRAKDVTLRRVHPIG